MGRHGENIRKRSDGRWEARYTVYDVKKGKKIYHSVYGYTYDEVKSKRSDTLKFLQNSSGKTAERFAEKERQNILFRTVAGEWLAGIKSRQKPSTYEKYHSVYHTYLKAALGETAIGEITETYVKKKLSGDGLSDKDLSDSLRKSIYCVLNRILKYACEQYSIVLPDIKKTTSGACKKEVKVFTKVEQAKLFSVIYDKMDLFKMAMLLCLFTGLRLGELCALKWTDIDFENKTLSVKRTVQRLYVEGLGTKTALVETEPKSDRSKREIPLQDTMIALLLEFQNSKEYVFGGDRPMEPRTMQNHYSKILDEARITHKNFHTLRHTYATSCIEGGADVKSLSEMLGHSDVQITLNYYVHPSMDIKRRYADRLCDFYAKIHGQIRGKAS